MKTFELAGTLRSEFGKKAAKGLRKQDQVPCNIYGANGNQTFTVNVADVRKLIYTPDTQVVALTIDGQKRMAVVKELQFHPVKETLFHIDFLEVTEKIHESYCIATKNIAIPNVSKTKKRNPLSCFMNLYSF